MNTNTEHKAIKISSRVDGWGMRQSKWEYRGVRIEYNQTTKRECPWRYLYTSSTGWGKGIAYTKSALIEQIDKCLDQRGLSVDDRGRIIYN